MLNIRETFRGLKTKLNDVVHSAKMAGWFAVLLGAACLFAAALGGGIYLQMAGWRLLSVFCAAGGGFVSGCIFAYLLKKTLDQHRIRVLARGAVQEKLETRLASAQDDLAQARADVARLQGQRINISSFSPIMKLSVCEAPVTITDVRTEWKTDQFKKGIISSKCEQYLGVLQREFTVTLGVDMQKICIEDRDDVLYVYGLRVENTGLANQRERWLLQEMRTFDLVEKRGGAPDGMSNTADALCYKDTVYEANRRAEGHVSLDLNKLEADKTRQANELKARIERADCSELEVAKTNVKMMTQRVLEYMLAPALQKKRIKCIWDDSVSDTAIPLEAYVAGYNARLELSDAPRNQVVVQV